MLVNQNYQVNDQNKNLIALCTDLDERLVKAVYIIDNHRSYYNEYQSEMELRQRAEDDYMRMKADFNRVEFENNVLVHDNNKLKETVEEQQDRIVEL